MLTVYLSKNLFELGSTKPGVARSATLAGAEGKSSIEKRLEAKQGHYLIGYIA